MTDQDHEDPAVGVLAMGDFGSERCGVGSSLAAAVATIGPVTVLDTAAPGVRRFTRAARAASRAGSPCVLEYPTRSTVYQRSLPVRAVILWATFGRSRLRLHLHEYQHLRRLLRWPVTAGLVLASRIVVSSEGERAAVQAAWRGRVGRWAEVVVAIPTNGSAPTGPPTPRPHPRRPGGRTVGVFGMRRDDKEHGWLLDALSALDESFDRLVLAGGGWEGHDWPPGITARYEVVALGHVAGPDLADVLAGWDLALAPFTWPAHDGRMSLRTPLAHGVPTVTVGPPGGDLTLRPPHLALVPPATVPAAAEAVLASDRVQGAAEVAAFERRAADRLRAVLFGPGPS